MEKNKIVLAEADERIKNGFNTLIAAKKSLEEAQTQLKMNLGYHFLEIYGDKPDSPLTLINNDVRAAIEKLENLARQIRTQLKV